MANAINIPKTHLIMGLSLPLAVLLGYFVAEPMELGSLAVVVFVLVVLSIPLLMKWYHPLLVLTWNASVWPVFLPGRPALWAILAVIGLLFAVLNRAVSPNARFVIESSVTKSLLVLTGVVVATGLITGGFGFHMLGSSQYGGRKYFYFLAAVAGYFVITSRRIQPQRAGLYVALFFLSALTFAINDLTSVGGSEFRFLWLFFPPTLWLREAVLETPLAISEGVVRFTGFGLVGVGLLSYLLARFGVRGLLDLSRPWRLLLVCLALVAELLSGFRGVLLCSALMFAVVFCLEGLHRTRYVVALLAVVLVASAVVLPQGEKLPLMVQRSLSFLPGKFNFAARESASNTVAWRLEMWKQLLPEVPRYLFRGKGWGFNARDFHLGLETGGGTGQIGSTILVGDYHNGPLSVVIPFGLYGAIAFVWFLAAGWRVLYRNWRFGSPDLRCVNALLFAAFVTRAIAFFCIFGSLESDMAIFAGTLGLSVALNGADAALARAEAPAVGMELSTEYIKA